MTRSLRAACLQSAVGALLAGCLGVAPEGAEEGTAEITLGGLWLNLSRPEGVEPVGWTANTPSIRRTASADSTVMMRSIPRFNSPLSDWVSFQPVDIESPLVAFSSRDRKLTLSASYSAFSDPFRSLQGTTLGIALWHRPAGTLHAWMPVHCDASAYAEGTAPVNVAVAGYFENEVVIDSDARLLGFGRAGDGVPQGADFASCGIRETYPEFAAMVIPTYVWSWRFKGTFDFDLYATCNGGPCSPYEGDAADDSLGRANASFMGLGMMDIPADMVEDIASEERLHPGQGTVVTGVVAGGPADQGGIQKADFLVSIDDIAINQYNLATVVEACSPGQVLSVGLIRVNGYQTQRLTLNVTTGYQGVEGLPPQQ